MKRSRSSDGLGDGEGDLDPQQAAVALLSLMGRQSEPQPQSGPAPSQAANQSSRRDYVWRGPYRESNQHNLHSEAAPAAAGADAGNTSSRRSSATHGISSDCDDEVAQLQEHHNHHQQQQRQQHQHQQQRQAQRQQKQPQQRHSHPKQTKQQQKQQEQKDAGKEWAALTTWLRMNLHNPRTFRRVILFIGSRDASTGTWSFSLNPEVSWQQVSTETKLRLKTLLVEAERSYLQKYPGRPAYEWQSKVQKYKPPGSEVAVDIPLWDVVNGLHSIYLQHEEPTAANNLTGQQQQQGAPQQQAQQLQQQGWVQAACIGPTVPAVAPTAHLQAEQQQQQQQQQQEYPAGPTAYGPLQ